MTRNITKSHFEAAHKLLQHVKQLDACGRTPNATGFGAVPVIPSAESELASALEHILLALEEIAQDLDWLTHHAYTR